MKIGQPLILAKTLTASIAVNFQANVKVKTDLKSLNKTLSTTNHADCSENNDKIKPSLVMLLI